MASREWSVSEIESAVREAFGRLGYPDVRDEQLEAAREFLRGQDVFVSLPTGSGKSFCWISKGFLRAGDRALGVPPVAMGESLAMRFAGLRPGRVGVTPMGEPLAVRLAGLGDKPIDALGRRKPRKRALSSATFASALPKPSRSWKHGLHTDRSSKSFLHRPSSEHTPSIAVVVHSDVLEPSVLRFLLSCIARLHKWQGSVFFLRPPAAVAIVNSTRDVGAAVNTYLTPMPT